MSEDCLRINVWTPAVGAALGPSWSGFTAAGSARDPATRSSTTGRSRAATRRHRRNRYSPTERFRVSLVGGSAGHRGSDSPTRRISGSVTSCGRSNGCATASPCSAPTQPTWPSSANPAAAARQHVDELSPAARGLFHRAIIMSTLADTALTGLEPERAVEAAELLLRRLGIAAPRRRPARGVAARRHRRRARERRDRGRSAGGRSQTGTCRSSTARRCRPIRSSLPRPRCRPRSRFSRDRTSARRFRTATRAMPIGRASRRAMPSCAQRSSGSSLSTTRPRIASSRCIARTARPPPRATWPRSWPGTTRRCGYRRTRSRHVSSPRALRPFDPAMTSIGTRPCATASCARCTAWSCRLCRSPGPRAFHDGRGRGAL